MSRFTAHRSWWRFTLVCVPLVLFAVVVWRQTGDTTAPTDFLAPQHPDAPTTVVYQGRDWTLELVAPLGQEQCYQVRVGAKASYCASTHYSEGDMVEQLFTGEGHRIALVINAGTDRVTGVSWARSGHSAVDSVALTDTLRAIVVDFSGDDPWGIQLLDSNGRLLNVTSYVGS